MDVVLVHRNIFQNRPPLVSFVKTMLSNGVVPTVITAGLNEEYQAFFKANGIKFHVVPFELTRERFSSVKNYLNAKRWGQKVNKLIDSFPKEDTLLWIEGNYTFTALNTKLVNQYKHVLQIQEMFDDPGMKGYLYKKVISSLSVTAEAVIVPEYNRAFLYKLQFGLKRLPFVLPNKPAFVPNEDDLEHLHEKYAQYDPIFKKRVILYQGIISSTRSNYTPVLDALKEIDVNNEYLFVFLGRDLSGYVEKLKKQGYNVEHIPFTPAPDYLYFTSRAFVGIVNYADNCMNNIYCAPNKIYEYSAFGVPMLANDIPGLRYTVGINHCGSLYTDREDVKDALLFLFKNHDELSDSARRFFAATDYEKSLKSVLDYLSLI